MKQHTAFLCLPDAWDRMGTCVYVANPKVLVAPGYHVARSKLVLVCGVIDLVPPQLQFAFKISQVLCDMGCHLS